LLIVQLGFTVGVTERIVSGISISTAVVGEPSQPCGTLNVTTVYEPAAVELALAVTWALAARAGASASTVPALSAAMTDVVVRVVFFTLFFLSWVASGGKRMRAGRRSDACVRCTPACGRARAPTRSGTGLVEGVRRRAAEAARGARWRHAAVRMPDAARHGRPRDAGDAREAAASGARRDAAGTRRAARARPTRGARDGAGTRR